MKRLESLFTPGTVVHHLSLPVPEAECSTTELTRLPRQGNRTPDLPVNEETVPAIPSIHPGETASALHDHTEITGYGNQGLAASIGSIRKNEKSCNGIFHQFMVKRWKNYAIST
ncbi:MAG: hypothetical protein JXB88_10505 [Spirochaetales bacterium]|nr:hypothetical protein [Spirochaetales bacterium]